MVSQAQRVLLNWPCPHRLTATALRPDIANAIRLRELFFQFELDRDFQDGGARSLRARRQCPQSILPVRESPNDLRRVRRLFSVFSTTARGESSLEVADPRGGGQCSFSISVPEAAAAPEARPLLLLPATVPKRGDYEAVVAASATGGKSRRVKAVSSNASGYLRSGSTRGGCNWRSDTDRVARALVQRGEPARHCALTTASFAGRMMTLERAVDHGIFARLPDRHGGKRRVLASDQRRIVLTGGRTGSASA